jgi:ribosome-associated toxin RatA of RatAB toxin-antitoxin module
MKMRNEIVMHAPADRIFAYASDTEGWPEILPHYRYVRVLAYDGARRIVEMAAKRRFDSLNMTMPVRWRAVQINDAEQPQISFLHLAGWTRGMQVYWRFEPFDGGTRVIIDHELRSPLAGFIGKYFIDPIATRTLRCIKAVAEQQP